MATPLNFWVTVTSFLNDEGRPMVLGCFLISSRVFVSQIWPRVKMSLSAKASIFDPYITKLVTCGRYYNTYSSWQTKNIMIFKLYPLGSHSLIGLLSTGWYMGGCHDNSAGNKWCRFLMLLSLAENVLENVFHSPCTKSEEYHHDPVTVHFITPPFLETLSMVPVYLSFLEHVRPQHHPWELLACVEFECHPTLIGST